MVLWRCVPDGVVMVSFQLSVEALLSTFFFASCAFPLCFTREVGLEAASA
jgi:hypothetical protein